MNRRDSARPTQRSTALSELERLVRQLGQPDQGLLDAASETMHGTFAELDLPAIPKFLEEAAESCVGAHQRWRETTPEQRALLRGCSLDLIGLAADQCLRLDRSYAEYRQCEANVKRGGRAEGPRYRGDAAEDRGHPPSPAGSAEACREARDRRQRG